jgi:sulfite exporter TauE/SafE/plastocyanin domain-containing protein/copper chaperone CopZ
MLKKATIYVDGMTCSSCETRVGKAISSLDGVKSARASLRSGKVEIEFEEGLTGIQDFERAVAAAGYSARKAKGGATTLALGIGVLLAAAYMIASASGIFNALPAVDASIGYGMLLVVGLLTSVHCVAMCGGIALSQSVGTGAAARFERLKPGLLYNGGRIISYTLVGALAGGIGSVLDFSPIAKGAIAAAAGAFMLLLGLRMLGLLSFPARLAGIVPAPLRAGFARLSGLGRGRGPFAVGLLNGLMPCGPLQTMQLYALGTGSAFAGALSMLIFSAGTVPLLLVFGFAAAVLPRKVLPVMVKASAVLVMFLGVVTVGRAAALAGLALPGPQAAAYAASRPYASSPGPGSRIPVVPVADTRSSIQKTTVADGVQTITTQFGSNEYAPFVALAGIPLKWTVRINAEDLNGCNRTMVVPAYGIRKTLKPGDNLIEFTPKKEGVIAYSCWMGMIKSRITVVSELGNAGQGAADPAAAGPSPGSLAQVPATGLGAKSQGEALAEQLGQGSQVPVDSIGFPTVVNGVAEVTVRVDGRGYSPAAIVLQKGIPARIKFKVDELTSCNATVVFPEYNGALELAKGELETPPIAISQDFTFQCGMGMLHGYVKVVDDLSKVNVAKLKAEIGKYRAKQGAGCCGG